MRFREAMEKVLVVFTFILSSLLDPVAPRNIVEQFDKDKDGYISNVR